MLTGRNKRSVTLNLKDAAAREVLYKLVADADVGDQLPSVRARGLGKITLAIRFMPYLSPNFHQSLVPDDVRDRHRFVYELKVDNCPERSHHIEMAVRVAAQTISMLTQSESAVRFLTMQHEARMPMTSYRRYFSCPVRFGQKDNAVVFDSRWLQKPVAGRNPEVQRVAEVYLKSVIDTLPRDLAGKVEALVSQQLTNPKCTIDLIAGQLAMHPRTLQRRLHVPNPMGKVLQVDRILSVAKYSGDRRFHDHPEWATQFARNAAVLTGREVIRVDVEKYTIAY